jgi:hypothetical protein
MTTTNIQDYIEENYPDHMDKILLADGHEDAFMGIVESFGLEPRALYDYEMCVKKIRDEFSPEVIGMNERDEMAREFMEYNVVQAYVGEHTPAFMRHLGPETAREA